MNYPRSDITGVVLAGGRARRMGGQDKGLVELAGRPMVAYAVAALQPQVGDMLVNANRNVEEYARITACTVISDSIGDYAGPLAGMASAMDACTTPYVLTIPCDSPLVSQHLARRLYAALVAEDAELAVAHDGERIQPVFALLRRDLLASLTAFLDAGESKIDVWYARHRMAHGNLADAAETFLNINTPEERALIETRLRSAG